MSIDLSYLVKYDENEFTDRMDSYFYHPTFLDMPFSDDIMSPISEVVKITNRKPKPGKTYKYIEISSVDNKSYQISSLGGLDAYNYTELPSRARKVVKKGDILFSKIVDNPLVAVVGEEHDGCVATNAFIVIKPLVNIAPDVFAYILRLDPIIKQSKRYSYSIMISNHDFGKVKIPIPGEDLLKKIVTKIENFNDKKGMIIKQYKNLAENINQKFLNMLDIELENDKKMTSFIVKGMTINSEKLHPSFYSPEYTSIFQVIESSNYEHFLLEDIINDIRIGNPVTSSKEGGKKYLSSSNIKPYKIDLTECKETENGSNLTMLEIDDLLIVSSGYSLGYVALVNEQVVGYAFNNHIYRIQVNETINPYYLMVYLNSSLGKNQFERYAGGIAQRNINSKDVVKIRVLLPPKDMQDKISNNIKKHYKSISNDYFALREEENMLEQEIINILS